MTEARDFRKTKLDEIMNASELLDFNYKVRKGISPLLRAAAILIVSLAIFTALPLLPGMNNDHLVNRASVVFSIDPTPTQIADFDI